MNKSTEWLNKAKKTDIDMFAKWEKYVKSSDNLILIS